MAEEGGKGEDEDGPRRVSGSDIRAFVDQQRAKDTAGLQSSGFGGEGDDSGLALAGTQGGARVVQQAEPEATERWGDFLPLPMSQQYGTRGKRKRGSSDGSSGQRGGRGGTNGGSRFGELSTLNLAFFMHYSLLLLVEDNDTGEVMNESLSRQSLSTPQLLDTTCTLAPGAKPWQVIVT